MRSSIRAVKLGICAGFIGIVATQPGWLGVKWRSWDFCFESLLTYSALSCFQLMNGKPLWVPLKLIPRNRIPNQPQTHALFDWPAIIPDAFLSKIPNRIKQGASKFVATWKLSTLGPPLQFPSHGRYISIMPGTNYCMQTARHLIYVN